MAYLWILLIVSLCACSIGWKYFIYFFSIGYGFSVAALAVASAVLFASSLSAPTVALLLVILFFGCRLSGYLLVRQLRSSSYKKILYAPALQEKKPFGVMAAVWFFCALLYVGQVSPVAFRLANTAEGIPVSDLWAWIGVAVMAGGVCLETVADMQKSASKKVRPGRFVDTGLYRIVRCPNYLGELVIWTGALLSGIGAGMSVWQWVIAVAGYLGIVYVMFSGTRRLELRQNESYGSDPEYQEYVKKTPVLLPFIPLYSVARYKWLSA